ncbi:MAG: hypothetical protein KC505_05305 [Myxococcales bacterium]|nr:hypothetical protein [Myxococcales bacterium]USN51515.1 MAG: hypothetical protein H6731_03670 [Myxococcales bacterium]
MKNISRLLLATFALVSFNSFASLVQPITPANEDYPVRINAGLLTGMNGTKDGFGVTNLGAGLGFAHNVGYDFEYGMSLAGNWASYNSKVFTDAAKGTDGARLDVEIMTRYMPEITDKFNVGLALSVGWGQQFGKNAKAINDEMAFGDLNFKAGPALSAGLGEMASLYFSVQYSLHNIRFGAKDGSSAKTSANRSGIDVPLGVWFAFSDSAGLFVEANSRITNFSDFKKSFREEVTLGLGFAL